MPGSRVKTTTRVTSRVNGRMGTKHKGVRIAVQPQAFDALFTEPERFKKLLETYGKALARSRSTGKKVRFEVTVGPKGGPKVTPIEEAASTVPEPASTTNEDAHLGRALAAARERGRARVAEIMDSPEMLTADAFAASLGTTRVTVNTWRQKHHVLGLEGAKRGFRFPTWQIGEDGKPFAILPELFERLGGTPWAVYRFLVQHHPELDGLTAQDALRRGREKDVLETAETVGRAFS